MNEWLTIGYSFLFTSRQLNYSSSIIDFCMVMVCWFTKSLWILQYEMWYNMQNYVPYFPYTLCFLVIFSYVDVRRVGYVILLLVSVAVHQEDPVHIDARQDITAPNVTKNAKLHAIIRGKIHFTICREL